VPAGARAAGTPEPQRVRALRAPQPTIDPAEVRQQLHGYLKDWQKLLMGHVGQAQQVLRRLVIGRLTFTPQADGYYAFAGKGTVEPLLGGFVRKLASPRGFADGCTLEATGKIAA
jgi:hypothetical protein